VGLEIQAQRDDGQYLRQMHGLPFTVVHGLLRIPTTTVLELLEYRGVDVSRPTYIPMDPGTGHVCFLVDDLEAMYAQLTARGYPARSPGPIEIVAGPNSGSRAVYFEDPDGYPVEFIERPAH
jgi:catechol 2,3-dioxygenase-like lactoylglutathione lyase family enzyme